MLAYTHITVIGLAHTHDFSTALVYHIDRDGVAPYKLSNVGNNCAGTEPNCCPPTKKDLIIT
jgi:hypothetical protein